MLAVIHAIVTMIWRKNIYIFNHWIAEDSSVKALTSTGWQTGTLNENSGK